MMTSALLGSMPLSGAAELRSSPEEGQAKTSLALVVEADAKARYASVIEAARGNLAAQGIELLVVELEPAERPDRRASKLLAHAAVGVFWLDTRNDSELRVVLQTRAQGRFSRSVPLSEIDTAAADEAVWLILQSNSLALSMGAAPSMEVDPEPTLETPAETSPAAEGTITLRGKVSPVRRWPVVELGASYAPTSVGRRMPWQNGVEVDATLHLDTLWIVGAAYRASFPPGSEIPVGWQQAFEVRGGVRASLGRRVEVRAILGAGLGGLQWRNADANTTGWRAQATASIDAGISIRVAGPVSLWIAPGITTALNRFALTECSVDQQDCTDAGRRVVFEAWPVQPRLTAGLRLRLPRQGGATP